MYKSQTKLASANTAFMPEVTITARSRFRLKGRRKKEESQLTLGNNNLFLFLIAVPSYLPPPTRFTTLSVVDYKDEHNLATVFQDVVGCRGSVRLKLKSDSESASAVLPTA